MIPIRRRCDSEDVSLWGSTKSIRKLVLSEEVDEEGEGDFDEADDNDYMQRVARARATKTPPYNPNRFHTASNRS